MDSGPQPFMDLYGQFFSVFSTNLWRWYQLVLSSSPLSVLRPTWQCVFLIEDNRFCGGGHAIGPQWRQWHRYFLSFLWPYVSQSVSHMVIWLMVLWPYISQSVSHMVNWPISQSYAFKADVACLIWAERLMSLCAVMFLWFSLLDFEMIFMMAQYGHSLSALQTFGWERW